MYTFLLSARNINIGEECTKGGEVLKNTREGQHSFSSEKQESHTGKVAFEQGGENEAQTICPIRTLNYFCGIDPPYSPVYSMNSC